MNPEFTEAFGFVPERAKIEAPTNVDMSELRKELQDYWDRVEVANAEAEARLAAELEKSRQDAIAVFGPGTELDLDAPSVGNDCPYFVIPEFGRCRITLPNGRVLELSTSEWATVTLVKP